MRLKNFKKGDRVRLKRSVREEFRKNSRRSDLTDDEAKRFGELFRQTSGIGRIVNVGRKCISIRFPGCRQDFYFLPEDVVLAFNATVRIPDELMPA